MSIDDRLKYLLVKYGTVIAVILALIGVITLGGAWTAAQPTETSEQVTVYQEDVTTSVNTRAVVTGNTTLYNQSEVLHNQPVYLFRATPNLTLFVNTSLDANRTTTVTHQLDLRFRATRDGQAFWQRSQEFINTTQTTTNGTVSTAVTRNISAIRETTQQLREEIGGAGTFSVEFRLEVTYEVQESPTYTGSMTASTPFFMDSESYLLGRDLTASQTEEEFAMQTETNPANPIEYLGPGGVGVFALLAAAGTILLRRDLDGDDIRTRMLRNRYEEWISRGDIPTDTDKRYVRIDGLEDIVDIGIDSNKRVIWNDDYDIYAVVDGDVVYYHSAKSVELDEWLNL